MTRLWPDSAAAAKGTQCPLSGGKAAVPADAPHRRPRDSFLRLPCGHSRAALPGYFRRRFSPQSQWHHRSQCRGNEQCSRSSCGRTPISGSGGKSELPWSASTSEFRTLADQDRCWRPTRRPAAHTAALSDRGRSYCALQTENLQLPAGLAQIFIEGSARPRRHLPGCATSEGVAAGARRGTDSDTVVTARNWPSDNRR
jgi:hypothetical protein